MDYTYSLNVKKKKIISDNVYLFMQVFQKGAIQLEKKIKISSFFSRNVKIGSNNTCDILIPYAKTLLEMSIFKVGRNYVQIILDPRLDGFLNTGNKFGELNEFITPRGALAQLSSIDDPLILYLDYGSRGKIRFSGYDIAFKIEKEKPEKKVTTLGAGRNIFQMPEYDIPIERKVIPISLLATGIAFLPILFWLITGPVKPKTGLINLPEEVAIKFIDPHNFRLLPFVFKDKFDVMQISKLSIFWVHELQKRWEKAEAGIKYESIIPFLKNAHPYVINEETLSQWEHEIFNNYKKLEMTRTSSSSERYFSFLKKYPAVMGTVSGIQGGSQYVTLLKRLEQLKSADNAIMEYLKEEHEVIKEAYAKEYNAKKLGIVDPPTTGQVLGRQPSRQFFTEFQNYKDSERFATYAEASPFRTSLIERIQKRKDQTAKESSLLSIPSIWITGDSLVIPTNVKRTYDNSKSGVEFANMWHNALYSTGVYQIPEIPPPKATIDMRMVEFVIFNKKEEIRSCYNTVLRKNPISQGDITLRWRIMENGKAANIVVFKSSISDKNLISCIESRLMVWNFPKPKNGSVVITYPFQFILTNDK